jgi:alkanesulfonate monooxygenase SsuD/methylene tetrahydromethanopterin reductase-like flavin-dependent oxidoreductase (luciferase family)
VPQLPSLGRRVPVYAAASGPGALRTAGAVADGVFVNHGLAAEHVERARGLLAEGARQTGRAVEDLDVWWIACLDVNEQVRAALGAGARNLMFTVSLASDPARTVELFGREVLPAVRGAGW